MGPKGLGPQSGAQCSPFLPHGNLLLCPLGGMADPFLESKWFYKFLFFFISEHWLLMKCFIYPHGSLVPSTIHSEKILHFVFLVQWPPSLFRRGKWGRGDICTKAQPGSIPKIYLSPCFSALEAILDGGKECGLQIHINLFFSHFYGDLGQLISIRFSFLS